MNVVIVELQGFECKVLSHYFSDPEPGVFIPYIFMEWFVIRANQDNNCPDIKNLVKLLVDAGYSPQNHNPQGSLIKYFPLKIISNLNFRSRSMGASHRCIMDSQRCKDNLVYLFICTYQLSLIY